MKDSGRQEKLHGTPKKWGGSDEASSDAEMTKAELKAMSKKQAHAMAECIDEDCYDMKDETPVEYRPFADDFKIRE